MKIVRIDKRSGIVWRGTKKYLLSRRQYDLLEYLVSHPGAIFERNHLLDVVWGIDSFVDTRNVDNIVYEIRKIIGHDVIKTYVGRGYGVEELAWQPD